MFVELAGALAGSAASAGLNKLLGGDDQGNPWQLSDIQNQILQKALDQSVKVGMQTFGRAKKALSSSYTQGRQDLKTAQQQAAQQQMFGFDTARALGTPYRNQGFAAFDKYNQLLGLPTPQQGSGAVSDALFNQQRMQQFAYQLTGNPYAQINNPGAAPAINSPSQITKKQVNDYLLSHMTPGKTNGYGQQLFSIGDVKNQGYNQLINSPQARQFAQQQMFNLKYGRQNQTYNNALNQYNQYSQMANSLGYTPQQQQIAAQYSGGLFN